MNLNTYVQEILEKNQKRKYKKLYHYTSAEGLLGIQSSSSLHLSEHQFLNDMDELKYGSLMTQINISELLLEEYNLAKEKGEFERKEIDFLNKILEKIKNKEKFLKLGNFYIACFSENGDDIAQWKGYSNFGEGYSIGFETATLLKNKTDKYIFAKVIYDKKKQSLIIKSVIKQILEVFNNEEHQEKIANIIENGASLLFLTSAFFKNPKFSDEKEWRLIFTTHYFDSKQILCKSGRFGIHSYHPYKFDITSIKEVIVGPKYDFYLNSNSLNLLFKHSVTVKNANLRIK
ncbi:DUF2971 domain-containing protein [Leptospira meyeri]|uniref:DUF2971 domain-containing protein n=1 Tax=Leptospira meyeri TaxID=29508 RepID=UPI0002C01300|nr:DUF2971 domain-containing protein [Leptospira meyeri]EMJ85531.1 PF11185 family protein [Leptospira meyeri serovar Semaranga str. Veldrot Semarang 173]